MTNLSGQKKKNQKQLKTKLCVPFGEYIAFDSQ